MEYLVIYILVVARIVVPIALLLWIADAIRAWDRKRAL